VIIDVHAHYTRTPPQLDAFRGRQTLQLGRPRGSGGDAGISDDLLRETLQSHVSQPRERGIDRLIWSPRAAFQGHEFGNETISRQWSVVNNDLIARSVEMYPDLFVAGCQLPLSPGVSPKESIAELERCVGMGFVSCNVNPDVSGGLAPLTPSLNDRWWYPLWESMSELGVVGLIHAGNTLNPGLHMNAAHYVNVDVQAVAELCFSKVLSDFPDLKLVIPHAGGGVPFHWNRMRGIAVEAKLPPFEETVRKLYFDLSTYDRESIELTIRKMGADNVLYSSEMFGSAKAVDPQTGHTFDDTVSFVREIEWLSDEDRSKIFEGNARRLYTLAKF
jgi:4-oxalmesaconate hydratase